jgi:hypothetical protein
MMIYSRICYLKHTSQQHNARINAAGSNSGTAKLSVKIKLIPLAFNELLGFLPPCHPASPEPSRLILSSNIQNAAWRFILSYHQRSMLERAQIIQVA